VRIAADHLAAVSIAVLKALGVDAAEAKTVADNLVMAERRGIATHGVNFLIPLAERIAQGLVVVPTKVTTVSDADAVCHLDGGNGLGQTAATQAMRMAIEKARRFGIGLSLVRNTNHIGLLAWYTLMAADEGFVGFCSCNGAASMAPWGGAEPFFGTNPFSLAAPGGGGEAPIVLDMSTSIVARGKIRRAERLKERIQPGWALDAAGSPTDDPQAAMKGTLLPIGGPKGYGMALFIDLVSGLLSGSKYGREVKTFHKPEGPTGVGVTLLAIDIARFMPLDTFRALVAEHGSAIRGSKRARDATRIYLPGEIEAEREIASAAKGIEVDAPVSESLDKLLAKAGLPLRMKDGEVRG
jgi:LDH2 family malate/lactate/ureidoglycolate dehydrogenase